MQRIVPPTVPAGDIVDQSPIICYLRKVRIMPTLLHVDSSMRHEGSRSRALSAHFAEAWQQANPDGTVIYRDLTADPIPHLDLTAFSANFVADDDRTEAQREARALTETLANEL